MSSTKNITSSVATPKVARLIKTASNLFVVDLDGQILSLRARKNAKETKQDASKLAAHKRYAKEAKTAKIVAGDIVRIKECETGEYSIVEVEKRKNSLVRPQVANVDQIVIIVAPLPKPDFSLIDKLIINATRQQIDIVLCLNKSDIDSGCAMASELDAQYKNVVAKTIKVSANLGDITLLKNILHGKLSVLAGQSAVGKSSLINALTKSERQMTNSLSEKIGRGKNTTTRAEIIKLSDKTYIVDTPGFSMLDLHGVLNDELDLYYNEYVALSSGCKFRRCTHTVEPDCAVKQAIDTGKLNKVRYDRYCQMQQEIKTKTKL